jgi:hypothetical protein
VLQTLFAQQTWPDPPQAVHSMPPSPAKQLSDAPHWLTPPPWQQAVPAVPHAMQVAPGPPGQLAPLAVHTPPVPAAVAPQQV